MLEHVEDTGFVGYIGQKLRRLRKAQNLTQLDLAVQVGITNGQISTIERGVSSPSIASLHKISQVLGVSMAEFFEDEPAGDVQVIRTGRGRRISGTDDNVRVEVLTQRGRQGGVNTLFVEIGSGELRIAPMPHSSDEYVMYLIRGKCNLRVGNESHILDANDAVYVKARGEQWIKNVGAGPVQAILVSQGTLIGSEVQSLLAGAGV
ncbi:MAG: XRE family transcriptional regulator [Candidatus Eisenbacteria bacterium]|nr:XRE family transcriptional regulator [Candidatus Eisenbacteria bacterium]